MSTVLHTPASIRDAARQVRLTAVGAVRAGGDAESLDGLIDAAVHLTELSIIRYSRDSDVLRGDRGKFDAARRVIAIDESLTDAERRFTLTHELGHATLDGSEASCDGPELDGVPENDPFPIREAYVTGYSPRQRAEVNASLFAAEFVAPLEIVRKEFLRGRSASDIAVELGVSATVVYGQLTAAFLSAESTRATRDEESGPETSAPQTFELHAKQREACDAEPGPTAVDAGPGTGKTRTLTERVLHLVRDRGVLPNQVLCLTFSNKAAEELRERCERARGSDAHQVRVQTFHAFGLDLLRDYPEQAGVRNDVTLLDRVDAEELLERHLTELQLQEYRIVGEPTFYVASLLDAISRAKDEMVGPERYTELAVAAQAAAPVDDERAQKAARRHVEVARVYKNYESLLQRYGAVDFGDLIYRTVRLLETHPEIAAAVSGQYPHILVDEYQDVNRASARLLQTLRPDGRGLWVVGDVRQAIYRFRGASPMNLSRFSEDFSSTEAPVPLVRNYRSAPELLRIFSSAAKQVRGSAGFADWEPERKDVVGRAVFGTAEDEAAELGAIVDRITASVAAGRGLRTHAVLCHRNADAQVVARALERAGIPAANFGDFFEREEVRYLLALLAYVAEYGATALPRVTAVGPHELSAADFRSLLDAALQSEGGLPTVMKATEPPHGMSAEGFERAAADWRFLSDLAFRRNVWTFFSAYLFDDGRYLRALLAERTANARACLLAIGQLILMARAFDSREDKLVLAPDRGGVALRTGRPAGGFARKRDFLRFMRRLWTARDGRVPVPAGVLDAVHVGTVHGAKGLEFSVVFVPYLVEGRFPFKEPNEYTPAPPGMLPSDPVAEDAELDALFFVAMTRARDELVISHALSYDGKVAKPSHLLRLVANARSERLFHEERWASLTSEGTKGNVDDQPRELSSLRLSELKTYLDCPRRFYYRYVLNLPEPEDGRAYLRYHAACRKTLEWLDEQHRVDELPSDWGSVEAQFADVWETRGPVGHVHEEFYRNEALALVRHGWQRRLGQPSAPQWQGAATGAVSGSIDGVTFTVPVSGSRDEGNVIRLGHAYFRPRKLDKDHLEHRYALLRHATSASAGGRPVVIDAHYPGEVVPVKAPQKNVEQRRLHDFSAAVKGIRSGRFPPEPKGERERECPRCPYGLVCPL